MKILTLPLAILMATTAYAADRNAVDFELKTSADYSYDSAVGITEIDQNSFTSDRAARFNINPSLSYKPTSSTTLTALYNRTLTRYDELDEYNLDVADAAIGIQQTTALGKFGYRYDDVNAQVDGDDFLTMAMHTLDWGTMLSDTLYWRVDYAQKDKQFDQLSSRNSDTDSVNTQLYLFFNQHQSSLVFGMGYDNEEAADQQFSNQALNVKLGLNQRLTVLGRPGNMKLSARYRTAEYDDASLIVGSPRNDDVYSANASYSTRLTDYLSFMTEVEYSDKQSNLVSADYERVVVRAGVGFSF
jgi:hypothetical protein